MKTYRYILLDWDGNLAKTLHLWIGAIETILQQRDITLPRETLSRVVGGGIVAFLVEHAMLSEAEAMAALEEISELVKQQLPMVELYPDAIDVLRDLEGSGKQLALITSSRRLMVEPILKRFSMDDLFDVIVCAEDTEHRKPHPQPLQKALGLLNATKDEAIMVGDTENDILAAHNAGVDSVLFYPVEHQKFYELDKLMAHEPTYVVSDFWDVEKIAKGLHAPS